MLMTVLVPVGTKGYRISYVEEYPKNSLDTEVVKDWTDGKQFTVQKMYGTEVTFLMTSKLFIATNNMLNFDHDGGMARRLKQQHFRSEFHQDFQEDESIGDGGKFLCDLAGLKMDCIVYSFGCNGVYDFQLEMVERTGCVVHIFDPSLSKAQRDEAKALEGSMRGRIRVHNFGIAAEDGRVAGIGPRDEGVIKQRGRPSNADTWGDVKRLSTIMRSLGHQHVDILKMDIDGMEWEVLNADVLKTGTFVGFTQLLIEVHVHNAAAPVFELMEALESHGYMAFSKEPNMYECFASNHCTSGHALKLVEFSFVNPVNLLKRRAVNTMAAPP